MSKERRKVRTGRVVSDKMDKTIVVAVQWSQRNRLYRKPMRRITKFYAHDATNDCSTGDLVLIEETRPISRLKNWRVIDVLERRDVAEVRPMELDREFMESQMRGQTEQAEADIEAQDDSAVDVDDELEVDAEAVAAAEAAALEEALAEMDAPEEPEEPIPLEVDEEVSAEIEEPTAVADVEVSAEEAPVDEATEDAPTDEIIETPVADAVEEPTPTDEAPETPAAVAVEEDAPTAIEESPATEPETDDAPDAPKEEKQP